MKSALRELELLLETYFGPEYVVFGVNEGSWMETIYVERADAEGVDNKHLRRLFELLPEAIKDANEQIKQAKSDALDYHISNVDEK